MMCGAIHLSNDYLCRTCRDRNPNWTLPEDQQIEVDRITLPNTLVKSVGIHPFPKGKINIPKVAARDYKATIIITTPNISDDNFRFCKRRIDTHTPGEHRIVVIETHYNEKPYNYARDINIGLRGVQDSDYLVMLNDDVFVEEGWLDKLVDCARQDKKIGVVGALLFFPGKKIVQHAGGNYDISVESWASIGQMPVQHDYAGQPTRKVKNEIYKQKDAPWCTGALLLITKECLDKIGLMDEELVAHCDDVEFCYRVWLNGFRVVYCPDVQAVHRENVTRKYGTSDSPNYVYDATKRLLTVLNKKKADKVQESVDKSNTKHYRPE